MDNYRILLAGRNRSLIDHFFIQLDDDFDCMTTSTRPEDILNHIDTIRFDAFIYCIQKEDREDYPMMMGYKEKLAARGVTFIVAGHKDECDHFSDVTGHMAVYSYAIPIPMSDVMSTVREASDRHRAKMIDIESRISGANAAISEQGAQAVTVHNGSSQTQDATAQEGSYRDQEKEGTFGATARSEATDKTGTTARSEAADKTGTTTQPQSNVQTSMAAHDDIDAWDEQTEQESDEPRKRVLVIDDDPMVLKLIQGHLGEHYDVASAISGKVAYRFMASRSVDLILLDYEMPEENGPQVYENIRKMEGEIRNVPIVFLTGVTEREKLVKALSLKPNGYLPKPINGTKLVSTVSKLIG